MKVVIIGGVAGGASAAARIRRLDESAQIVIFERSGYISYANCGLPYFIGGAIEAEEELTLQTPQRFEKRFRIDARVRHEALSIDRRKKSVRVKNLETGEIFEEGYDKLILSPGARPIVPPLQGVDSARVFVLRTVEDTLAIDDFIRKKEPRSAVVIGAGFVGLEMAENLSERGAAVTLVEKAPQVLTPLDADMASFLHGKLRKSGVRLIMSAGAESFAETEDGLCVHLDSGETLRADMAVLSIGVTPESTLAREAGLELGMRGSIAVDAHLRTSDPDIYAVGDAVQVKNGVTGENTLIPLAGPANKQGRIAADNICGACSEYRASFGSSVIKVFDMTAAATGLNERAAKAAGLSYDKIVISPAGHASYYPGSRAMTMKVLFEKGTLRLLGAQIVGFDGVDKRIDVLATAMQAGLSATALKELELAYAPPYSSAKDPVNMAGFVIENVASGLVRQFHYEDLGALSRGGDAVLLDVRTPGEYAAGHAESFVNIPLDDLRARLGEIEPGKPVYVMCQSALRSYLACRILSQNGFECYNFSGGYRFYQSVAENEMQENVNTPCGMKK